MNLSIVLKAAIEKKKELQKKKNSKTILKMAKKYMPINN